MATYHYRGKCYHIYGMGDVAKPKIVGLLHGAALPVNYCALEVFTMCFMTWRMVLHLGKMAKGRTEL